MASPSKHTKRRRKALLRSLKVIAAISTLFVLAYNPLVSESTGRLIAVFATVLAVPAWLVWLGLQRRHKLLGTHHPRPIGHAEAYAHVYMITLGAAFLYVISGPFLLDLAGMIGGETPMRVTGTVRVNDTHNGLWVLKQGIELQQPNGQIGHYSLWFSFGARLEPGSQHTFLVLPRSGKILQELKYNAG